MEDSKVEKGLRKLMYGDPKLFCFKKFGFVCKRIYGNKNDNALCVKCIQSATEQFFDTAEKNRSTMNVPDEIHKKYINMLHREMNNVKH